ncbi:DEKNAAC100847 [Brettanomyces naardenensis]|uniref:DEKNAAC100847 n=1 Tax=Brettanomyces naardenensis TaxID=13370 RepID=A0A448YEM1_BRENA|nr:DEKNAAC100847 [Brettanomyces naardenensis]
MAKIAIIIYSLYHHIAKLAEAAKAGVEASGSTAEIFQVPETLPAEILKILHAPARPDYPIATLDSLEKYDGILFGIPTRFGNMPAQLKSFIDGTGALWASGALYHKPAGIFVSTGTGSGNELTVVNTLSTLAHHGMIFVPLGYAKASTELTNITETHGGSAWGAGTIAAGDGSRQPSELELSLAKIQGEEFAKVTDKLIQ